MSSYSISPSRPGGAFSGVRGQSGESRRSVKPRSEINPQGSHADTRRRPIGKFSLTWQRSHGKKKNTYISKACQYLSFQMTNNKSMIWNMWHKQKRWRIFTRLHFRILILLYFVQTNLDLELKDLKILWGYIKIWVIYIFWTIYAHIILSSQSRLDQISWWIPAEKLSKVQYD